MGDAVGGSTVLLCCDLWGRWHLNLVGIWKMPASFVTENRRREEQSGFLFGWSEWTTKFIHMIDATTSPIRWPDPIFYCGISIAIHFTQKRCAEILMALGRVYWMNSPKKSSYFSGFMWYFYFSLCNFFFFFWFWYFSCLCRLVAGNVLVLL